MGFLRSFDDLVFFVRSGSSAVGVRCECPLLLPDSYSIGAQRGTAKGATADLICDLVYWYAEHDGNDRDRAEGAKTVGGLTSQTAEFRCDVVSDIPAGGGNVRRRIAR
jgi:hypothetical protein